MVSRKPCDCCGALTATEPHRLPNLDMVPICAACLPMVRVCTTYAHYVYLSDDCTKKRAAREALTRITGLHRSAALASIARGRAVRAGAATRRAELDAARRLANDPRAADMIRRRSP